MPSVTGERLAWELRGGDGRARQEQDGGVAAAAAAREKWVVVVVVVGGRGDVVSVGAFNQVTYLVASGSRRRTRSC